MNYEQEIIDEISSKKDCSIDEAKKMIENLPLEYFFKKLTNTCLLYEIISKNKENLLAAFHNKFFNDVNWNTPLISGRAEESLGEVLLYYYQYSKILGVKSYSLFLNDINFIGDGEKIFLKKFKDIYVEKGKPSNYKGLLQKMVLHNDYNLLSSFFSYFKHYDEMIEVLMTPKFKNIETLKNIIAFLEIPFDKIMEKIDVPANSLCDFDDLKDKNYKNAIIKNPKILIENMHSMEIIEYIYSLLNNDQKEELLKNIQESSLKKGNFRFSKYDVKSKEYTMISAIKNCHIDFIKFMLNEGYELNDFEKVAIKREGFEDQLPNFEDALLCELNEQSKNFNDEEKFALALKYLAAKKIIKKDFIDFINKKIDIKNLSVGLNNFYFNNKATDINIEKDYRLGVFSAIDALLNLGCFEYLFKQNLTKLTCFQQEYLKNSLTCKILETHTNPTALSHVGIDLEEIKKINYKQIREEISENFITEIYKKIFLRFEIPYFFVDEILADVITDEELEINKDFLLGYSYPMFKRYIKSKGSPSEKHILMLSKSIKMNIKSIRQQDKVDRNNSTYFNILMEDIRKNNDIPISTLELFVKDLDENPEVKNIISSIIENKKIESILIAKDSDSKTKKRL